MTIKFENLTIFPFLFSIFPVVLLFSENIDEINLYDFAQPLFLTIFSSITLFLILNFFIRNSVKTGLILSYLASIFFSYGYIFGILQDTFLSDLIHHRFLLPFFLISTVIIIIIILRTKKNLHHARSITNVVSVVMILFVSINIFSFYINNDITFETSNVIDIEQSKNILNAPDIYHIILDEYSNSRVLYDDLNFDNSLFINYLKNSNFYVIDNAFTNYDSTETVLYSILNLEYLTESNFEKYQRLNTDFGIDNNFVMKFLKQHNYEIIVPYSGYGSPNKFLDSDKIICSDVVFLKNRFFNELSRTTILNYFVEKQIENERRFIQECTLRNLPLIGDDSNEKPVYVFTHLFIPHPPYLFDKDGNHVTPQSNKLKGLTGWNNKDGYINEIQFANNQIIDIVSKILSKSDNVIIIIQGDTGNTILNNSSVENYMEKRLSILYAIYLPTDIFVPDDLTPINTYRLIFTNYFNEEFESLENKYFYNIEEIKFGESEFSKLKDITDLILEYKKLL